MNEAIRKVRVALATGNEGKVKELLALFAEPSLDLISMKHLVPSGFAIEETGLTFSENAWLKAEAVCVATGLPAIADDSGLEVDALGGRPGVRSARYAGEHASDADNNALLLRELSGAPREQRRARFRAVLAFVAPSASGPVRIAEATGSAEGLILEAPRGSEGFGYDPLFESLDFPGQTMAELSLAQKNKISHRAQAAFGLAPVLKNWLSRPC